MQEFVESRLNVLLFVLTSVAVVALARLFTTRRQLRRALAEVNAAREIIDELSHDHWTFLAIASRALTSSLDYAKTLGKIALLPVPDLADVCSVYIREDNGRFTVARYGKVQGSVTVSTEVTLSEDVTADSVVLSMMSLRKDEIVRTKEETTMAIPLNSRNITLGALVLSCRRTGFEYTKSHKKLAEQLAASAALAIDNARLYEKAQREVQARERTMASISHDLKNPLCAIDVSTQLMTKAAETNPEYAKLTRHVQLIRNATTQMDGLIRNLLDAAKIKAGSFTVEKEPRSLDGLLLQYLEFAQALATPKGIHVTLDSSVKDIDVLVDAETMQRAFSNILSNAIKFTPAGGRIHLRVVRDEKGTVHFTISDSGPGIQPDHVPYIFNDFWQAQSTAKLGTGLGLTIAKGIVEAHGGHIGVEPRCPLGGAAFTFTMGPAASAAAQPQANPLPVHEALFQLHPEGFIG